MVNSLHYKTPNAPTAFLALPGAALGVGLAIAPIETLGLVGELVSEATGIGIVETQEFFSAAANLGAMSDLRGKIGGSLKRGRVSETPPPTYAMVDPRVKKYVKKYVNNCMSRVSERKYFSAAITGYTAVSTTGTTYPFPRTPSRKARE